MTMARTIAGNYEEKVYRGKDAIASLTFSKIEVTMQAILEV
jgi:hypothetical protein